MKLPAGLRYLSAAVLVLAAVCAPSLSDVDDRPIVVIREDDCASNMRTKFAGLGGVSGLTYAKQKGIPITWGVITNWASNDPRSLTWTELLDYYGAVGGEFASHSCSHQAMPDTQSYINEIVNSKAAIEARVPGYQCTTFIQPGMWTGDASLNGFLKLTNPIGLAIQATYSQSQAYLEGDWRMGTPYYKYGRAVSYTIDYSATTTSSKSLGLLDIVAQTPGLVYVVTFHGVQETGGTTVYCAQANVFKDYMDKLASLRDQGKIRLLSMNDAYHAPHSPNLDMVADPGLELSRPEFGNDAPWQTNSYSSYVASGGVNNSRYAVVTGWALNGETPLPPGRYRMSWSQKPEPNTPPGSKLVVGMLSYTPEGARFDRISFPDYQNADPNQWERRSAVFKMDYAISKGFMQFAPKGSGGPYGVDDVSVVAEPIDPAVSPSGSGAVVTPTALDISWNTPNDPAVTSIRIRYDSKSHPESITQGSAWAIVPAIPGTRQHVLVNNVNWASQAYMYFSVFAVRADGNCSPPDLVDVRVDKNPPFSPGVSVITGPDRTVAATWSSSDPDLQSGVYGYSYAVGSEYGSDDIVHWTPTLATSASVVVPGSSHRTLYFGVKAQNLFGYWSPAGSAPFVLASQTASGNVSAQDGCTTTLTGIVSAVFSDCLYVQDEARTRGLKVVGVTGYQEGDAITVTGVLSTVKGERLITATGH